MGITIFKKFIWGGISSVICSEITFYGSLNIFNTLAFGFSYLTIIYTLSSIYTGARWLSGRVSDSGARGPGFETYRRRVVSLSKTLYSPKVLVNYPGSDGSVPI